MAVFVGDDWAEDHHDVEVQDERGRRLAVARLPEGVEGIAGFHAVIAPFLDPDDQDGPGQVVIGIETDRGPWVAALVAAGYRVFAVNPVQLARYRDRLSTSGAKSDAKDAHALADLVRTDAHQLRATVGDTSLAAGMQVLARAHQNLVWERTRTVNRLRSSLREYFPAAVSVFADQATALVDGGLSAPDVLELLGAAPEPGQAARLSNARIAAALRRARRRGDLPARARQIQAGLRAPQLELPAELATAHAATTTALVAILTTLTAQIRALEGQLDACFSRHPDAEIYRSQPGLAVVLGARVLGEFGDDPARFADAKARRNYAGTSPITRASGKKTLVLARYATNRRLVDALGQQAFCALNASPGARAYYDQLRARGHSHRAALRQLANRLVAILHGCLKTRTLYDEHTAWAHHQKQDQQAVA